MVAPGSVLSPSTAARTVWTNCGWRWAYMLVVYLASPVVLMMADVSERIIAVLEE